MIVRDGDLTPYGELVMQPNTDCEFCGRSLVARFGGIVADTECPSCRADFERLNRAGKLVLTEIDEQDLTHG